MEDVFVLIAIAVWAVVGGIVGYLLGRQRGTPEAGAAMGVFLGFVGWLFILTWKDERTKCPQCLGVVPKGAALCMHCGSNLQKNGAPAPPLQVSAPTNDREG